MKTIVWKDGRANEAIEFPSEGNGNADLDKAAQIYGYLDYADMAKSEDWEKDDGLNIRWVEDR